ncbi:MAG TPA: hypothetical protein VI911_11525 [Patescibacteria group bacterium]|nr:hypothetical protein [Patescibacteria group bacterium]
MVTNKDIGFFKKLYLIFLTWMQVGAIKNGQIDASISLAEEHFRVYFGLNLRDSLLSGTNSSEVYSALNRHANMVVKECFGFANTPSKSRLRQQAIDSFISNIQLEVEL